MQLLLALMRVELPKITYNIAVSPRTAWVAV